MFDVTTPGAQNAIDAMSDVLSGSPDSQDLPMPSPNDARAKNTPEKKAVDLGPKLAKKRSQDFASKIQGWNQAGGGIVHEQDEVVVIEERAPTPKKVGKKASKSNGVAPIVVVEPEPAATKGAENEAKPSRPTTPKTPGTPAVETPKTSGAKKTGRDVDLGKGAWVRRKSKPSNEPTPEVKGVGTPKKRVISDGHWRRDRTKEEPKPTPEKEKDTTPKPVTIKRSVVNVGMKFPPSHQDFAEPEPEPEPLRVRPLRQSRSKSRSPSADGRRGTPDYETSGTKVYIKRRRRSRTVEEDAKYKDPRKSESSFTAPSSIDKPSYATDITTPSTSPPKDIKSEPRQRVRKAVSKEDGRVRSATQSLEAEDAQRVASGGRRRAKTPVSDEERRRPSTSAQAYAMRITENLKKPSTPPAPTPAPTAPAAPKIYGNRIEGWLANMPDPFTDERSLTPEPLDIPKKKSRRRLDTEEVEAAHDESRKSSGQRRVSRKEKELVRDIDERHDVEESRDQSPSGSASLKRRGARKKSMSPVKGRDSRDSTPTNDAMMSGALPASSLQSSRTSSANTQSDRFRIPSGGKPLSTILSVDTHPPPRAYPQKRLYPTIPEDASIADGSVLSRASDGDSPRRNGTGLKRRATKHEDLMSVLSMSRDDSHPVTSRRSIRASRRQARPEATTVGDIMNELSADELRYQRELRTLVDGVIPVLLQHALSDNGSAPGKRVFSHPTNDTRPIVDMGVALEKLKTMHKRIPMHEPGELLTWADGAARLYSEYLRAWRLGFKDIVVNLAPADQSSKKDGPTPWDDGLPRNKDGDLVDGKGERVDVAYLLKRPLVRVKYLAKVFKTINQLQPSANAEDMTARYNDLVADAKKRVNDEQARLEDEAAAAIDATRARDPRSLAPITGVSIDPTRSVRARDYFDMDLNHSSGQQLGCKIEIIYRDDAPDRGKAGDLLFCEVSTIGRWLLFPPLPLSLVSARKGERPGELVIMIRGFLSNARQWREVMSLQADDEQTAVDWLPMLGSSPMPPRLSRKSSFNMLKAAPVPASGSAEPFGQSGDSPDKSMDPSPREIEVPIGERAKSSSRIWDGSEVNSVYTEDEPTRQRTAKAKRYYSTISPATPDDIHQSGRDDATQPAYFYDQPRHDMFPGQAARRPVTGHSRSKSEWTGTSITSSSQDYSVWMPTEDRDRYSDGSVSDDDDDRPSRRKSQRPGMHRRTSSVPSMDMPSIPKVRQPTTPKRAESPSSDRDMLPSQKRAAAEREADPASAPATLQKRRLSKSKPEPEKGEAPPTPKHSRPLSLGLKSGIIPTFTPDFMKKGRRPSSPLKHEYEPSSASDSLSDSYFSDLDDIDSLTSESDEDEGDEGYSKREDVSTVGDLNAFQEYAMRGPRRSPPPASLPVLPENTLDPSESASQAPYRTVPPTRMEPAKTVACIFSWSERGTWDSLHPEECQVYVTPGLIEAFDIAQANSVPLSGEGKELTPSSKNIRPLIALELTPLVPLRRGTAVDISIRSPPTANSVIRMGNNVMFRSRSPEECEKLYNLINRARIDNPTYIALTNARGPVKQSNWSEAMDRQNSARTERKSWWNLGSKMGSSYRSKGSRTASIAATESSIGTVGSAFSALRRFSGGSRIFDLAKSTIQSKTGTRTRSTLSESLSSGAATPVPFDTTMGTPLGITNAKVRLYVRESAAKWRDMGSARMNVMLPPRPDPSLPANPKTTGTEKRILLVGKSKGETLLDVTLGENAFERVARTGIAVSVYEEKEHIGAVGGVMSAKTTVFMVQMKSERDAAYTFGLVGKLRY